MLVFANRSPDHLGHNDSIKAVCFPAACATGSSFDKELLYKMGMALGEECQAENVSVILGPAINIKRSPLCGRNFEYVSEDLYLAGKIAASFIQGIQGRNVGVSLKHFAANNQEFFRTTVDVIAEERTLREIYLTTFEIAVKESYPWTVMCSYNKINGTQVSENKWLLTKVLREEWDFNGCVVSDWYGTSDRVVGMKAGLDLEMPYSGGHKALAEAANNDTENPVALEVAVEAAKQADVTVIFAGLPDIIESEAYDRENMQLPECQHIVINAVAEVQPNIVVVIHNGSPVEMPWIDKVKSVLELYLGGQAVDESTVSLLFGETNPSGKLAETFPVRVEDTPSYENFPGDGKTVHYHESIFDGKNNS
jgi:beta-glucosidase